MSSNGGNGPDPKPSIPREPPADFPPKAEEASGRFAVSERAVFRAALSIRPACPGKSAHRLGVARRSVSAERVRRGPATNGRFGGQPVTSAGSLFPREARPQIGSYRSLSISPLSLASSLFSIKPALAFVPVCLLIRGQVRDGAKVLGRRRLMLPTPAAE